MTTKLRGAKFAYRQKMNPMMRDQIHGPAEAKPRPTRKNYPVPHWPPEHLATIWGAYLQTWTPTQILVKLKLNRPDIINDYRDRTGREVTVSAIIHRIDKAKRRSEIDNYKHLVPAALLAIAKWI